MIKRRLLLNRRLSKGEELTINKTNEHVKQWKKELAAYTTPHTMRSVWQLINSVVPFILLWFLAYWSLSVTYWLTLVCAVLAAGFMVRIFIIFHDCCHRSFFKKPRWNDVVGILTGLMVCCSYFQWKKSHAIHHATSGNLNRRGTGDVWIMTKAEYLNASPWLRFKYRMYRNPIGLFVIGPLYLFLISYRFVRRGASKRERIHTYLTNLALLLITLFMGWLVGFKAFLMIQGPIFFLAAAAGVWLFYVQHQFEDGYFEPEKEWDYEQAALQGSSYYKLPRFLQWFSGNIGFHHVHHLNAKIPNYYLEKAHWNHARLQQVPTITLRTSLKSIRFKVWDEERKAFVGFKDF
jgi:omega-6 fatty acid desaturase (delta-12 desaturase)